jgi:adenylate kinase family enzyme
VPADGVSAKLRSVKRVLVTGNAGSGKTSLSRHLSAKLGHPVIHLDKYVWRPGWRKAPKDEVALALDSLLAEPNWIIDGVSSQACRAADTIIFLDFPVTTCLFRAFTRTIRHVFNQRPEVPENCPERAILWRMTEIILQFPKETRPRLLEIFGQLTQDRQIVQICSRRELRTFLSSLETAQISKFGDSFGACDSTI